MDDKTVFYVFGKIIKNEYGKKGEENLKPDFFKNGKLFIKTNNSSWANELWINREEIKEKLNSELKADDVKEIKIKN